MSHIKSLQLNFIEQGAAQLNTSEMLHRAHSNAVEHVKRYISSLGRLTEAQLDLCMFGKVNTHLGVAFFCHNNKAFQWETVLRITSPSDCLFAGTLSELC